MVYKLCYIEYNKAYFTSDWNNQWGDDWDNVPYEHNACPPYHSYMNNGVEIPIKLKEIYFELPGYYKLPNDGCNNSPFSVQDINNHRVPWLTIDNHYIFAGTSYTNFVKQIFELGGTIYVPKKGRKII